jgi:hypothetical protein
VDDFEQDAASFDVAGPVDERSRANPHFYLAHPFGQLRVAVEPRFAYYSLKWLAYLRQTCEALM